jgi:hypothetical protein
MKNMVFAFFLGLASLILSTSASAATYPLVCRGGGGTLGYNSPQNSAYLYFQKSSQSAGAGLAPGQCSWVDRAIGPREPTCVQQSGVSATAWIFPGQQIVNSYFTSDRAPWLRQLLSAGTYQTFQVQNPGNGGCFVIHRLGP